MCWGSGGGSSETKQQQQLNVQETQQTMQFQSQLMSLFQQQFQNQQNQLNFLKGVMQPVLTDAQAGKGFSDEETAAMRTGATDTISQQFTNAQQALNQQLKTAGDVNVPSGVTAGADLALLQEQAKQNAAAQNTITLANAQQARSNLFNAANVLNGVAAQNSPNALMSGSLSGGATVAGLSGAQSSLQNVINQANANSFFGKLSSSLGSGLGAALGGVGIGELGTGLSLLGSGQFGF